MLKCMYILLRIIFKGIIIDQIYIKEELNNIIKRQTALSINISYGYKFLKYLITNLKFN